MDTEPREREWEWEDTRGKDGASCGIVNRLRKRRVEKRIRHFRRHKSLRAIKSDT